MLGMFSVGEFWGLRAAVGEFCGMGAAFFCWPELVSWMLLLFLLDSASWFNVVTNFVLFSWLLEKFSFASLK